MTDETSSTFLLRLRDAADQTAWRTFDRLYRPLLVGYARCRGLGSYDAEDVAQECMTAVLDRIRTYEHTGSFKTWLRAITEKKICDRFRKRKSEALYPTECLAGHIDNDANPSEEWDRRWQEAHFRHCLNVIGEEVPETTMRAFLAYAVEEQPVSVVAEQLGWTPNQVYVAKHRILKRIRALMLELTGDV